jgi:hypothetical protein
MSDNCQATVKINVVVYKPKDGEAGFDIVLVDTDSFAVKLSNEDSHECSKEIQKLLAKTKETWTTQEKD